MALITITLDDEINNETISVNLDADIPVSQVIGALIGLRSLPAGDYDHPRVYELIRIADDSVLRTDLSLRAQGIRPGEGLALSERGGAPPVDSRLLMALGAVGVVAILCVLGVLISTLMRSNSAGIAVTATLPPTETATLPPTEDTGGEATPTFETDVTDEAPGSTRGCLDNIEFVADVTIPDGTELAPGETFTKTWRVKNNGTCTWTPDYQWFFIQGDQMGGPASQILAQTASPGAQIDISVAMRAPLDPGTYLGYWQLRNSEGERFGSTPYVEIKVVGPTPVPADVTASASPAAAQTLTEIVTISATVSRSVAAIRIVTAGTDADGKAMDLGSKTCENASACSMDFGGNSNTYSGAVTYTAYACEHKDPCDADNNLGSDEGTFTVAATLNKPSRLVVASAARCCTNRGISIDLVWGSVVDATRYEIGYQFAGGSFVKVGDSVVTDYSFEIQQAGAYPLILSVRACNAIVCSEYTTVTIATSPK